MIEIIKEGVHCSIQDKGRFGYRHMGVPISGWMDQRSALISNMILGNRENDAVIEMGPIGLKLVFHVNAYIALTGAPKKALLNNEEIQFYKKTWVSSGDVINIKSGHLGVWTYLSVCGGIQTESIWNSRSTFHLAGIGKGLIKGVCIPIIDEAISGSSNKLSRIKGNDHLKNSEVKVRKGPEFGHLTLSQQQSLLDESFTIGRDSDRMGYYLVPEDKEAFSGTPDIVTSLVGPGTIQLPPSGVAMALMKDCQTTGGYARVLQIVEEEIDILSQKRPGEKIKLAFKF